MTKFKFEVGTLIVGRQRGAKARVIAQERDIDGQDWYKLFWTDYDSAHAQQFQLYAKEIVETFYTGEAV